MNQTEESVNLQTQRIQVKHSLMLCLFFVYNGLSGCIYTARDEPLIFHLQTLSGVKSCLIALNHVAIEPATETPEISDCRKSSQAYVFEQNPAEKPELWVNLYKKMPGDVSLSNFTLSTQQKIESALKAGNFSEQEIRHLIDDLHPFAIYKAMTMSTALEPNVRLMPNIDSNFAFDALKNGIPILEMEGNHNVIKSDRATPIDQLDILISAMAELLVNKSQLNIYHRLADQYAKNLSAQPNIETALEKKISYNTKALGLPAFSVTVDVLSRNEQLTIGLINALEKESPVLAFIGAAHLGGKEGVIERLQDRGIKVTRIK
jgi:TraB/PrgY/gumN family